LGWGGGGAAASLSSAPSAAFGRHRGCRATRAPSAWPGKPHRSRHHLACGKNDRGAWDVADQASGGRNCELRKGGGTGRGRGADAIQHKILGPTSAMHADGVTPRRCWSEVRGVTSPRRCADPPAAVQGCWHDAPTRAVPHTGPGRRGLSPVKQSDGPRSTSRGGAEGRGSARGGAPHAAASRCLLGAVPPRFGARSITGIYAPRPAARAHAGSRAPAQRPRLLKRPRFLLPGPGGTCSGRHGAPAPPRPPPRRPRGAAPRTAGLRARRFAPRAAPHVACRSRKRSSKPMSFLGTEEGRAGGGGTRRHLCQLGEHLRALRPDRPELYQSLLSKPSEASKHAGQQRPARGQRQWPGIPPGSPPAGRAPRVRSRPRFHRDHG
jgi:hypothetical protein